MHLVYIQSSPRGPKSISIAVADAFLEVYRRTCPGLTVDTLNVWEENLPEFDQEAIGAKYKGINKEPMDSAEAAVWDKIQELAKRFQRADRIVLGVPMWNFSYPPGGRFLTAARYWSLRRIPSFPAGFEAATMDMRVIG